MPSPRRPLDGAVIALALTAALAAGPAAAAGGSESAPLPVELLPAGAVIAGESGVTLPQRLSETAPRYPGRALLDGVEGEVALLAEVGADGSVGEIRIASCSRPGHGFEASALRTAREWRFQPALRDGRPVTAWTRLSVAFVIDGAPGGAGEETDLFRRFEPVAGPGLVAGDAAIAGRDGVSTPVRRRWKTPHYPQRARMRSVDATVWLLLLVDAEGAVTEVRFAHSDRDEFEFRHNCVDSVRNWSYRPARRDGGPVEALVWVIVEFRDRRVSVREAAVDAAGR